MKKSITKFIYITICFLLVSYGQNGYAILFIDVQNRGENNYLVVDSIGVN